MEACCRNFNGRKSLVNYSATKKAYFTTIRNSVAIMNSSTKNSKALNFNAMTLTCWAVFTKSTEVGSLEFYIYPAKNLG